MAAPQFNARSPSIKRIMQESRELASCPDPTLTAAPLESNLFEWHFTLRGPPSSVYAQGIYHGRIVLPASYPLRPPSFRFLTPSGRFETNREICLSISGHHEETWQPAWGIRTALCAIRAFMAGDAKGQVGGLDMHPQARERLARESRGWKCAGCGGRSNEEIVRECEERWEKEHGHKAVEQQQVPEELRLAFREDLDKENKQDTSVEAHPGADAEVSTSTLEQAHATRITEPNAAAAVVPGVPTAGNEPATSAQSSSKKAPPSSTSQGTHASTTTSSTTAARATGSHTSHTSQPVQRSHTQTQSHPASEDAMPAWIDKAIIGLALCLIIMLFRRFAGVEEEDF